MSNVDARIVEAIRNAKKKGRLSVVAAVTGVPTKRLNEIIKNQSSMSYMERSILSMHLS